eukprot:13803085-Alexandrium_andersonii.AAC.1
MPPASTEFQCQIEALPPAKCGEDQPFGAAKPSHTLTAPATPPLAVCLKPQQGFTDIAQQCLRAHCSCDATSIWESLVSWKSQQSI